MEGDDTFVETSTATNMEEDHASAAHHLGRTFLSYPSSPLMYSSSVSCCARTSTPRAFMISPSSIIHNAAVTALNSLTYIELHPFIFLALIQVQE